MTWYELATNPQVVTELYTEVPSLQAVYIFRVGLYEEGARMIVGMYHPQYPDRPPAEWKTKGYNAVYVRMEFCQVQALQITRWSTTNLVDVALEATPDGHIAFVATSSGCHIQALARWFTIASVNAYLHE